MNCIRDIRSKISIYYFSSSYQIEFQEFSVNCHPIL